MNTYLAKGSNITFSFSLFTKENVYLMSSTPALSSSRDHVITRKNSNRYRKNIIHIPEGISYIATEAFQHQSCIRSVSFPDSLRKIGARAFQGCTFMESALLPQSMVQLGPGAFSDCPKLEKQFIPSGISELPREIFRDDQKLQSVTFGENSRLHIIRDNAFPAVSPSILWTFQTILQKSVTGLFIAVKTFKIFIFLTIFTVSEYRPFIFAELKI